MDKRASRAGSQWLGTPRVIWGFTAVSVVVIAAGFILQNRASPTADPGKETAPGALLARPIEGTTARGSFEWKAISGAAEYQVTVQTLDGTIVFQDSVKGQTLAYPAIVDKTISTGKLLYWEVVAQDASGDELAWSGVQPFGLVTGKHR